MQMIQHDRIARVCLLCHEQRQITFGYFGNDRPQVSPAVVINDTKSSISALEMKISAAAETRTVFTGFSAASLGFLFLQ